MSGRGSGIVGLLIPEKKERLAATGRGNASGLPNVSNSAVGARDGTPAASGSSTPSQVTRNHLEETLTNLPKRRTYLDLYSYAVYTQGVTSLNLTGFTDDAWVQSNFIAYEHKRYFGRSNGYYAPFTLSFALLLWGDSEFCRVF